MNCANLVRSGMILPKERNTFCIRKTIPVKCLGKTNVTSKTDRMIPLMETIDLSSTRVSSSPFIYRDMITWYHHQNCKIAKPAILSDLEMYSKTVYFGESTPESDPTTQGRPSEQQLDTVMKMLSDSLPKLFLMETPPVWIFHRNVILDNHISGTRTIGLGKYMSQVALLKVISHIKFAYIKFHILKITKHPKEGTIKCRWRIEGIDGLPIIRHLKSLDENAPTWYDGFSTYYVESDGLIHRHVIDKMMPDDHKIATDENTLVSKIASYLGSLPKREQRIFIEAIHECMNNLTYLFKAKLLLEKLQRL